ncbi:hypothetical protein RCC89_20280 [Cytophagaceae bacterium ABcell3]|nr:hypothetical protein RCC89_20280 [Cytophagaceae bacterium ABcell3]
MRILQKPVTVVEKESIGQLKFTKDDVLTDPAQKRLRTIYLKKAEALGNGYKNKVKLVFQTDKSDLMAVETTIWSANDEFISLKGGLNIPTKSIVDIEF